MTEKPRYRVKAPSNRITDSLPALTTASRGLVNSKTGLGGSSDKATFGSWTFTPLDPAQLEAAFRSNWMAKKAVNIPAFDMLRNGWAWQGDVKTIQRIERTEAKHKITRKLFNVLSWSRLYGGAAILVGDGGKPSDPLDLDRIKRGGLEYMIPLSALELKSDTKRLDFGDRFFGLPERYNMALGTGSFVYADIHPSKVIRFTGEDIPRSQFYDDERWGDSVLEAVEIAIRAATAGQQGIASLVEEAAVDVMKIPDLMARISDPVYLEAFQRRVETAMTQKAISKTLLMDAAEEHSTKQINFASLEDVALFQVLVVCGATDIPATRFLGQSPNGLNSTGESDIVNYYDGLDGKRKLFLRDPFQEVFEILVRDALRSEYPTDLWWEFRPLWQLDEEKRAAVNKTNAETAEIYDRNGLLPAGPLRDGVSGRVIEDGVFPGYEAAKMEYDETGGPEDQDTDEPLPDDEPETDPLEITDAAPRTLYVYRKVENAAEIIKWAKSQGFEKVISASTMHCTIAYSKRPVDWMKAGDNFEWVDDATMTIKPGGPRIVEELGEDGAVVLHFACASLGWRHEQIRQETGAAWAFDEYQPHLTLTYEGQGVDLSKVEPYRGKIVLGPEVFEEVSTDWTPKYSRAK